jgi:hypothetical protein
MQSTTTRLGFAFHLPEASRRYMSHLGILALIPLALAFFNDYWAFTSSQAGMIDPWLYVSYFLHLKPQLLAFPSAYYGDRLSFTLLGWGIYHIVGPLAGNYVLKLLIIYTGVFSLYFSVFKLFNGRTALFAASLASVQPYFLMAFGWDYVDGIGIAYFSLSLLYVVLAVKSEKYQPKLFWAGIWCTCLVSSDMLWLNLAWTLVLAYYLLNRISLRHPVWKSIIYFALGSVVAFLGFCAVYRALAGHWFYLANSLRHTLESGRDSGLSGARAVNSPVSQWIGIAHWLIHLTGLVPIALWGLYKGKIKSYEWSLLAVYLASYATVWVWQTIGFPFAKLLFYADYVFPAYLLALAALVHPKLAAITKRFSALLTFVVLAAGTSFIFLVTPLVHLAAASAVYVQAHPGLGMVWKEQACWLTAFGVIGGLALAVFKSRPRTALIIFSSAFLLVCGVQLAYQNQQGWFRGTEGYSNKQAFETIIAADAWADRMRPDRRMLLWYNNREAKSGVLGGLSSLYLWGWSLINTSLPELQPADYDRIGSGSNILAISTLEGVTARARGALYTAGFAIDDNQETKVSDGGLTLHLEFFNAAPKAYRAEGIIAKEGLKEVAGALPLAEVAPDGGIVSVQADNSLRVVTLPVQWAYAAAESLPFRPTDTGTAWIRISTKVLRGSAGFGVLTRDERDFSVRTSVQPSHGFRDVMLMLQHPEDSSKLIVENDSPRGEKAEIVISSISLFARADSFLEKRLQSAVPSEVPGLLRAADILPTTSAAFIQKGDAVHIITGTGQWSYAAYLPLKLPLAQPGKVWVRISAKVLSGTVGFGILSSDGRRFHTRTSLEQSPETRELTLPLDHPADSDKLIIENDTPGGQKADVVVSQVTVLAAQDSNIRQPGKPVTARAAAH